MLAALRTRRTASVGRLLPARPRQRFRRRLLDGFGVGGWHGKRRRCGAAAGRQGFAPTAIASATRSPLDDAVDDAERQRLGSRHDAAAGDQLDRRRDAGEARQALRAAGAGHDAELHFGQAELGLGDAMR